MRYVRLAAPLVAILLTACITPLPNTPPGGSPTPLRQFAVTAIVPDNGIALVKLPAFIGNTSDSPPFFTCYRETTTTMWVVVGDGNTRPTTRDDVTFCGLYYSREGTWSAVITGINPGTRVRWIVLY